MVYEKMRIYITGIAGMLGYGIYRTLNSKADIFGNDVADVEIWGLPFSKISLFDMKKVEEDILKWNTDVLVHTAAMVDVDGCERNPEMAEKMNAGITAQLSELCHKHQIKMVYISTDAVFDGDSEELYMEGDMVNPVNVYGRTKLKGEMSVLKYPINLVLRTNIFGINIQEKKSFGEWIYTSLSEGQTLKMFTDIDFSPILTDELAELIFESCTKGLHGLYHACGTGCINKYDFGIKLKKIFNISSGKIIRTTSDTAAFVAKRAKHMGLSNRKLREELQIKISTPEQSIQKFYQLVKERGKYGNKNWE